MTSLAAPKPDYLAFSFVGLSTLALSFKGIFATFAYQVGMDVNALLLLRFGLALPIFWLGVMVLARKTMPLQAHHWRATFIAALFFFSATYADFKAIQLVGVSVSRLVLFTFPVWVMLLNAALARTMPPLAQWGLAGVTYGGIVMVLDPSHHQNLDPVGVAWALCSALSYALYLVASQQIMKSLGSVRFTAASGTLVFLLSCLILPFALPEGQNMSFPLDGIVWAAVIAIFCTALPFFFLFEGIKRCGATTASMITMTGPVITLIAAWLIFDERFSLFQMCGAALTLIGVILLSRLKKTPRPAQANRNTET